MKAAVGLKHFTVVRRCA